MPTAEGASSLAPCISTCRRIVRTSPHGGLNIHTRVDQLGAVLTYRAQIAAAHSCGRRPTGTRTSSDWSACEGHVLAPLNQMKSDSLEIECLRLHRTFCLRRPRC